VDREIENEITIQKEDRLREEIVIIALKTSRFYLHIGPGTLMFWLL
jgi:hypothetical protein